MILLLDLGNTNLYIGIYQNGTLINDYRTDSDLNRSADTYRIMIKNFIMSSEVRLDEFEGAILSSVIPSLTSSITEAVERLIKKPCFVVGSNLKTGLSIHIDNPNELGADLVCDSVGAIRHYGYPCIICDLGTANKFLVIDKNKNFCGCVISPGIKISGKALSSLAAQLMDISYQAPKKVIGKNSPDSLNSGAIYGTIAQIEGLTSMIEEELGYKTAHILTGGNSFLIHKYLKNYTFDPTLIFKGLDYIYNKNKN